MKKIGFIGMGNMAKALASGFLKSGKILPENLFAFAPNQEKLKKNAECIGFHPMSSALEAVEEADTVIMAAGIKPRTDVVDQFKENFNYVLVAGDARKGGRIATAIREGFETGWVF